MTPLATDRILSMICHGHRYGIFRVSREIPDSIDRGLFGIVQIIIVDLVHHTLISISLHVKGLELFFGVWASY